MRSSLRRVAAVAVDGGWGSISSAQGFTVCDFKPHISQRLVALFRPLWIRTHETTEWRGHSKGIRLSQCGAGADAFRIARREYATVRSGSSGESARPTKSPANRIKKVRTVSRTGAPIQPPNAAPNPEVPWYTAEHMRASETIDLLYWHQTPFEDFTPPPPPTILVVPRHSVTSVDGIVSATESGEGDLGPNKSAMLDSNNSRISSSSSTLGGDRSISGQDQRKSSGRVVLVVQESKKERKKRRGDLTSGRNVFTPQMLVPLLPSYFIPISSLLSEFPEGYTEQHIAQLFEPTGTVEIVCMKDETYIRLHGGKHFVDVTEATRMKRQRRICPSSYSSTQEVREDPASVARIANVDEDVMHAELAYERHEFFRPNPQLCKAFAKLMPRANRWVSLHELIMDKSTPALRSALHPFTNYRSLLYFAQMQHHFNFTPQGDGEVCFVNHVALLTAFTSPIPTVVNELISVLKKVLGDEVSASTHLHASAESDGQQEEVMDGRSIPLSDLTDARRQPPYGLSMFSKKLVMLYFDTLENFIVAHQSVFAYSSTTGLVTLRSGDGGGGGGGVSQPVQDGIRTVGGQSSSTSGRASKVTAHCDAHLRGVELTRKKLELIYGVDSRSSQTSITSSSSSLASAQGDGARGSGANSTAKQGKTLEDKLEEALARHDRLTAQKFRRHIAMRDNPDSPYTDREVLMDAIMRYFPRKRSISLRFLLKMLPSPLRDFLPDSVLKLFRAFAVANVSEYSAKANSGDARKPVLALTNPVTGVTEKLVIFEFRVKNNIHVMRIGLPMPDGHLRFSYTEEELLFMCSAEIREKSRRMSDIYGRLPYFAREQIRIQYKGLIELLQRYPMYFMIVFPNAVRMDSRAALVTLLKSPATPTVAVKNTPSVRSGTNERQESVRKFTEADWGNIDLSPEQQQWLEEFDLESVRDLPDMERTDVQSRMKSIADNTDEDLT